MRRQVCLHVPAIPPPCPKELLTLTSFMFSTSIHPSSRLTVASTHNPLQGYKNLLVAGAMDLSVLISLEQLLMLLTTFYTSLASPSCYPISWFLSYLAVSSFSSFFSPEMFVLLGSPCQRPSFLTPNTHLGSCHLR